MRALRCASSVLVRTRRTRFWFLGAALLSVATVLSLTSGAAVSSASGEEAGGSPRTVTIDAKLTEQLAANPTGGVTAIVTAWGRDGLRDVEALGVTGTKLRVLPMIITTTLTKAQLDQLATSPAVRSVWAEHEWQIYMEDTTWITKARYVWGTQGGPDTQRGFGVTGRGVELAMIDTGFDGGHEDGDNLIEFCDTTNASAATGERFFVHCTPWDPTLNAAPAGPCGAIPPTTSNQGPGPTTAPPGCRNKARGDSWVIGDPDVSHGTHVGGTMVGTGHASGGRRFNHSTIGMAPDAKLRAYSANVGPSLLNTQTLAAYDDMTYKKEIGYSNVIAVNNSWGGGDGANYDPSDPTAIAVKRAYDAGIVSVFAAGNSGPEHNTLSAQCVNPYVVCVAASTKPDSVVMFSSRGRPSQPQDTNRNGRVGQPGAPETIPDGPDPGNEPDPNPAYDPGDVPPDNHDRLLGQKLELGLYRPTLTAPGVNINSMKAVGANIGDPGSLLCREDDLMPPPDQEMSCYVQANGTSMATPHVTGAIGLIGQVLQQRGRNIRSSTFSRDIIDILERSANTSKLPAWESEEQGAGRLDVHQAVRYARGDISLRRPNFGYPTPPYVTGQYPDVNKAVGVKSGPDDRFYEEEGCTGTGSWTAREIVTPVSPGGGIGQPPGVAPQRYGQHFIEVPPNTDRLRITARFADEGIPTDNLYIRLWRPGVNPDAESATPDAGPGNAGRPSAYHQSRVFPDQEAVGLVFTGNERWLEVRSPEEDNVGPRGQRRSQQDRTPTEGPGEPALNQAPGIPAGVWILRVYHRAGVDPVPACNPDSQERPKQAEGHDYSLHIELPGVTYRPSVRIDSVSDPNQRFVTIRGRAGYPPHTQRPPGVMEPTAPPLGHVGYSWEGITNWEVPGSSQGAGSGPEVPTVTLYMHGKSDAHPTPDGACSGNGETDVVQCNGPFLMPKDTLSTGTSAFWRTGIDDEVFDGTADRNIHDPNWSWCLAPGPGCPADPSYVPPGPQTISGPMTVEWWASCNLCDADVGLSADWFIRVWGDGVLRFQQRVTATPADPGVPSRLEETVTLPTFTASQRVVVHIDPVYIDSQTVTNIYYDSAGPGPCTGTVVGPATGRCDSLVRMPAQPAAGGDPNQARPPETPDNVRVTDLPANPPINHPYPTNRPLSPALRVAWDELSPAPTRYEVYRSTDPLFPGGGTRVFSGAGAQCTSPQAPTPNQPPGHDRGYAAPGTPPARCFTDTNVSFLVTYYYRVVAVRNDASTNNSDLRSANSEIAYGAPTRYDRQVKVKVDRLYGPQYWEYALLPPSPTPPDTTNPGTEWLFVWDTLELLGTEYGLEPLEIDPDTGELVRPAGPRLTTIPHLIFARSFTQGIGSTKDGIFARLDDDGEEPPPGGGGCPDDDDGDGDDDSDDDDSDDDGDDSDDDCEDDSDDSESDDD
jgi:subtilisin family serine protease